MGKHFGDDQGHGFLEAQDNRFYGGKVPSENEPYIFDDLCDALFQFLRNLIGLDFVVFLGYYFTRSIEETCLKAKINKRTFYKCQQRLMKRFDFIRHIRKHL